MNKNTQGKGGESGIIAADDNMFMIFLFFTTVSGQGVQNNVRLIGGISWGRVEIFHDGIWGTICSNTWRDVEARVVCRMLGYRQGYTAGNNFTSEDSHRSWLSGVKCNGDEYSLHHCKHNGFGADNCTLNQNVGVRCYNSEYVKGHLSTRLSLGPKPYEGHVEVQFDGLWGGICDDGWNDINAKVVCRSLGIKTYYAMAVPNSGYAADNVVFPVWLRNVICNGSESNIGFCQYKLWDQTKCPSNKTAGVICYKTVHHYLRLKGGNSSREGRVQFYYRGQWGAFCDRWDDNNAHVVCRTLGLRGGIGLRYDSFNDGIYGNGNGKFWAQWINCKGNETKITDCPNNIKSFEDRWCRNMGALSVRCLTDISNATLRLVYGSNERHGMIEVNVNGIRGTICDMHDWTFDDAMVACRMLGFNDTIIAVPLDNKYTPWVTPPRLLKNVRCGRDQESYNDCDYTFWKTDGDCTMFRHINIGVNCIQNVSDYIRLVNGKFPKEGTIEFFHRGHWGGLCNLYYIKNVFTRNEARTVCKTLGYSGGIPMEDNNPYGHPSDRTSIYTYKCGTTARHIGDCFQKGYDSFTLNTCNSYQAGVRCIEEEIPRESPVRLVLGQNDREGIVEVYFDNMWWTLCDDDWDMNAAKVVCRSLGRTDGYIAVPVPGVDFGQPDTPVLFQNVKCKGDESGLGACSYLHYKGAWRCRPARNRAAVKCLTGFEIMNGTDSVLENKTEIYCPVSEKQIGYRNDKPDTSVILYGVVSGLVMYAVVVTVLTLVLAFIIIRSKQHKQAQLQINDSLSQEPESTGKDKVGESDNDPTAIVTD